MRQIEVSTVNVGMSQSATHASSDVHQAFQVLETLVVSCNDGVQQLGPTPHGCVERIIQIWIRTDVGPQITPIRELKPIRILADSLTEMFHSSRLWDNIV